MGKSPRFLEKIMAKGFKVKQKQKKKKGSKEVGGGLNKKTLFIYNHNFLGLI